MKYLTIIGITLAVVFTYIIMLAMQPATNALITTANATTGNWTVTPEFGMAQGVINAFPLWQWFLPGLVGLIGIAITWKSPS
jgi:hypothetical protein